MLNLDITPEQAAHIVATRLKLAAQTGGLVKVADAPRELAYLRAKYAAEGDLLDPATWQGWAAKAKREGNKFLNNLANTTPGATTDRDYGSKAMWETARNALYGAGIGGAAGLGASLFERRRKRRPFANMLYGAGLGALAGGGGTAAYRGLEYATGDKPSTAESRQEQINLRNRNRLSLGMELIPGTNAPPATSQSVPAPAQYPRWAHLLNTATGDLTSRLPRAVEAAQNPESPVDFRVADTAAQLVPNADRVFPGLAVGALTEGAANLAGARYRAGYGRNWNPFNEEVAKIRELGAEKIQERINAPTTQKVPTALGDRPIAKALASDNWRKAVRHLTPEQLRALRATVRAEGKGRLLPRGGLTLLGGILGTQ